MTYHVQILLLVRQPLFDRAALLLTQTSWVLPPLSVGKMTLRLYGALNYSHGLSKGPSFGTGRDDPSGPECDHGGCRLSLLDPLLDPRSRLEILRVVSADTRRGGYQDRQTACEKPEFELLRGALGEVCEGRMSIEADLVRRASIQTVSGFLSRSLSWREEPSRQGKRHSLSVCRKQRPPRRANPLSGKARWAAEILVVSKNTNELKTCISRSVSDRRVYACFAKGS